MSAHRRIDAADVKARVHLPDLLPSNCKRVKVGRDALRAQCPIHGGEHLSLGMKDDGRGWWFNCWSCGESGDAFKFVMLLDRCSFGEALRKLAGDVAPLMGGPAPKRKDRPKWLMVCAGKGCGKTAEIEAGVDWAIEKTTPRGGWTMRAGDYWCSRCDTLRALSPDERHDRDVWQRAKRVLIEALQQGHVEQRRAA